MNRETKIRVVSYLITGVILGILNWEGIRIGAIPSVLILAGAIAITELILKEMKDEKKDGAQNLMESVSIAEIKSISDKYMVSLTEEQIKIIMRSSMPKLMSISAFLPKGIPDSIDFKYHLSQKYAQILAKACRECDTASVLRKAKQNIDAMTEESISHMLSEEDAALAPSESYLKGTVNYEKIALSLLMQAADGNQTIVEKLQQYPQIKVNNQPEKTYNSTSSNNIDKSKSNDIKKQPMTEEEYQETNALLTVAIVASFIVMTVLPCIIYLFIELIEPVVLLVFFFVGLILFVMSTIAKRNLRDSYLEGKKEYLNKPEKEHGSRSGTKEQHERQVLTEEEYNKTNTGLNIALMFSIIIMTVVPLLAYLFDDNTALTVISSYSFYIGLIILVITSITKYNLRKTIIVNENAEEELKKALAEAVKEINDALSPYMITLTEDQCNMVIEDENTRKSILYVVAKFGKQYDGNVTSFKSNLSKKCEQILRKMKCEDDFAMMIVLISKYIMMLEDEDIRAIISFEDNLLPPGFEYLKGIVNYDSVSLMFIMNAADELYLNYLKNKIFDYMVEQGYTTEENISCLRKEEENKDTTEIFQSVISKTDKITISDILPKAKDNDKPVSDSDYIAF